MPYILYSSEYPKSHISWIRLFPSPARGINIISHQVGSHVLEIEGMTGVAENSGSRLDECMQRWMGQPEDILIAESRVLLS